MTRLPDGRVLYVTDEVTRFKKKHRRDMLRAAGRCINGAAHGPATHGCLCASCRATHRGRPLTATA